jgi:signal peptidase II
MKPFLRLLPTLLIALALDVLTKAWAEQTLVLHQPAPVLGEFFRLTLGYNTGVAFGLFASGGALPLVVTGVIIIGLVVWLASALRGGEFPPAAGLPIGLILGGAIANFADRLPDGRVTDFLDVGLGASRWPTFNLADSFIVLGVSLLMLIVFKQKGSDALVDE